MKFINTIQNSGMRGRALCGWTRVLIAMAAAGAVSPETAVAVLGRPAGGLGEHLKLGGELLARHEDWQWMGGAAGDYGYDWVRLRLRAQFDHGQAQVVVEPWWVGMYGLPGEAVEAMPAGPAGMGGLYYAHNREENPDTVGLHKAYVRIDLGGPLESALKAGRYAYASGLAHQRAADGPKFNTLKTLRLGDRLLSSFEWSAFGRSFDGVQLDLAPGAAQLLTAGYARPTQGGWEKDISTRIEDIDIAYIEWSLARGAGLAHTEPGLYLIGYRDQRQCSQRVDNCGQPQAEADIEIVTAGGHLVGMRPSPWGEIDYLLWFAVQAGDWYEQTHAAYAIAAEIGHQWPELPGKPWLRAGLSVGSGDDDPGDNRHETFHQLAPGTRKYQLFPYYDFQNSQSAYLHAILKPGRRLTLRFDASANRLDASADRWYMGTGPTQSSGNIFGYIARPSGGGRDLSAELSLNIQYHPHPRLALELFIARVWGGEVMRASYPEDVDATLFTLQASTRF